VVTAAPVVPRARSDWAVPVVPVVTALRQLPRSAPVVPVAMVVPVDAAA
jgi:hypothetical protein